MRLSRGFLCTWLVYSIGHLVSCTQCACGFERMHASIQIDSRWNWLTKDIRAAACISLYITVRGEQDTETRAIYAFPFILSSLCFSYVWHHNPFVHRLNIDWDHRIALISNWSIMMRRSRGSLCTWLVYSIGHLVSCTQHVHVPVERMHASIHIDPRKTNKVNVLLWP